jgi:hypothetical protein
MNKVDNRTMDDVINYLVQSKKEMQEEGKKAYHTPEFQESLARLRAKKKK